MTALNTKLLEQLETEYQAELDKQNKSFIATLASLEGDFERQVTKLNEAHEMRLISLETAYLSKLDELSSN